MKRPVFDENTNNSILNEVHEGMRVCDNADNEIGNVRQVFLGAASDRAYGLGSGPATADESNEDNESLIDYIAKALDEEPLPEVLRERLKREGFIRIDTHGLFASDRYALPDQIESVSDDCVRLRLAKDELIER
jgi:hypothetical protein